MPNIDTAKLKEKIEDAFSDFYRSGVPSREIRFPQVSNPFLLFSKFNCTCNLSMERTRMG